MSQIDNKQMHEACQKLVLLHGWGMNARVWQPVLPMLQSRYLVQALDLPGHGHDDTRSVSHLLQDWSAAVASQVDAPAVWVGWSLGGLIALAATQQFPDKVAALVLVASTPRFAISPDWPHAIRPSLLHDFATELRADYAQVLEHFILLQSMGAPHTRQDARLLRQYLHEGGEPQPQALAVGLEFLLNEDLRPELSGLKCPCLLLLGQRDRLVPAELASVFRRQYPQIDVELMPGSGHAPFLSQPQAFTETVSTWIENLRHAG